MGEAQHEFFLVDGSGYIFRAFFALPELSTSRGLPTNAVFGFIRMLLKLTKERHPTHIGVVFDSPKKTFRDDLFADYKANRAQAPNDLTVQIPYIRRVVEAFRVRSVIRDGYEADDVIATLAQRAARNGFNTVIITADKDFMQIIGPRTRLWDTMRNKWTGTREVRERFGLEPGELVDVQALTGDPIDNIKGVPGVGEKTAAALIQKFGGLENLYRNLDKVAETNIRGAKRLPALLAEHRAQVELARKLVRIDTNVPLDLGPGDFAWPGVDEKALAELLRDLEFSSLLRELTPVHAGIPAQAAAETTVDARNLAETLEHLRHAPYIAVHLGASEAGPERLKLYGDGRSFVVGAAVIPEMGPVLADASPPKLCHDLKHHLRGLKRYGVALSGVDFDTMLAGFLINSGKPEPDLSDLYHSYLAGLRTGAVPGGSEPAIVAALRDALEPKLRDDSLEKLFREIELPIARILAEMEETGIKVDTGALKEISKEFGEKAQRLEHECYELVGREFNLNSPTQLREILFTHLKLPTRGLKRTKSGYSTDADSLEKLTAVHLMPRKLLEYRMLVKLKSTYSDALAGLVAPATGRVHTTFHQALTATGRLSSSDPNLQNIPTRTEEGLRIRRAFIASPGHVLLSADYSQIDLRVLAHLSDDPTLTAAFRTGQDIHVRTATEILGVSPDRVDANARRLAKTINFGIIYGMGPQRLAGALGISMEEATAYIKRYFERLQGVSSYVEQTLAKAREVGFVTTMYGRRRYLPELNAPEGGARAQAERIAVNTPIQGTAADLIKVAMVRLWAELKRNAAQGRMLLQVHDELLLEVEHRSVTAVSELVKRAMEGAAELRVPLKVELKWGPNWAELGALQTS